MNVDLFYLTLSAGLCAILWIPYVLSRIQTWGLVDAVGYPANPPEAPAWAKRAARVHSNMVENLAPFAALVLVAAPESRQAARMPDQPCSCTSWRMRAAICAGSSSAGSSKLCGGEILVIPRKRTASPAFSAAASLMEPRPKSTTIVWRCCLRVSPIVVVC
jgi:hypothetical protein